MVRVFGDEAGRRVLEAHFTARAPTIDGVLEEVWSGADSARGFLQQVPDAGKPASEATTVYLLYDRSALYLAYRCAVADPSRVNDRLSEDADGVRLFLDTFGDRTTCYRFDVGFNGREESFRVTRDGSGSEYWEGVWWSAVRRYPWGFVVEMAIPFKSLRYHRQRREWGIDFCRVVVARGERSFWSAQEVTGFKVSRMGRLVGIVPPGSALHLEIYPVGLVRQEKRGFYGGVWSDRVGVAAGVDGAYFPSPSAGIQFTTFPDFAQIEADPYQVNLSRYELWLAERRPFFTEAMENFGGTGQPIKLFYSRRIGKPLPDGRVVPILGGVKYTDRFRRGQLGALLAVTGAGAEEPGSFYSVFSARRQVFGNSEIGVLYAGKDNRLVSNHGAAFDGVVRSGNLNSRLFLAGAQQGDSLDWALSFEGQFDSPVWVGWWGVRQIQPDFDMNGPGYTTWRGQYFSFYTGPAFYNRAGLQNASLVSGAEVQREWGDSDPGFSWAPFVNWHSRFLNQRSLELWTGFGRLRDMGRWYYRGYLGGYFGTDPTRPLSVSFWGNYDTKSANYRRGVIAPDAQLGFSVNARIGDRWSVSPEGSVIAEAESTGTVDLKRGVTLVLRPGTTFNFSARSSVRLVAEWVRSYDLFAEKPFTTWSVFGLYSWRFRPRSMFYFALNWLRAPDGAVQLIQVVKVNYLLNI